MSRLKVVAVLVSCSFTVAVSHSPRYLFPFALFLFSPLQRLCSDDVSMYSFSSLNTHPPSPFSFILSLVLSTA